MDSNAHTTHSHSNQNGKCGDTLPNQTIDNESETEDAGLGCDLLGQHFSTHR